MEIDSKILIPPGTIRIYSENKRVNNSALSDKERFNQVLRINSPENLSRILTSDPLYKSEYYGAGIVETVIPETQYSYGGVMVVASDGKFFRDEALTQHKTVSAFSIFDCNPESQHEYFMQIIANILSQKLISLPKEVDNENEADIIAYENFNITLGNEHRRVPRSLSLPHTMIIRNGFWIDRSVLPKSAYSQRVEEKILIDDQLLGEFKNIFFNSLKISESMPLKETIKLLKRDTRPFGYTLDLGVSIRDNVAYQAEALRLVLSFNLNIFSNYVFHRLKSIDDDRRALDKKRKSLFDVLIPQPSYRSYIYYDKGNLRVTISPEIFSRLGAIDAAGAGIDWNSATNTYSKDELSNFYSNYKRVLKDILLAAKPISNF